MTILIMIFIIVLNILLVIIIISTLTNTSAVLCASSLVFLICAFFPNVFNVSRLFRKE